VQYHLLLLLVELFPCQAQEVYPEIGSGTKNIAVFHSEKLNIFESKNTTFVETIFILWDKIYRRYKENVKILLNVAENLL